MNRVLLYMHGGSGNKGCEAIVRSTIGILNQNGENEYLLASWNPLEDKKAGLDDLCKVVSARQKVSINKIYYLFSMLLVKIFKNSNFLYKKQYKNFLKLKFNNMYAFSIGGDNYCYNGSEQLMRFHHKKVKCEALKSYLWGCSIEKHVLNDQVIEDLKLYDIIFARESLTFNFLMERGLNNVKLYPDPAFTLKMEKCKLPKGFIKGNTLGLNLSPYAFPNGMKKIALSNYKNLINWVLSNTDMTIALIPHVDKEGNSDTECLKEVSKQIQSDRVILVDDQKNCMQTKYIISNCRFFVGARTHSTIAAYSTNVPTLVLGYSVKSAGIAKDIFGNNENYVFPVDSFKTENDLLILFQKMMNNEENIRQYYSKFMGKYIEKAFSAVKEIDF